MIILVAALSVAGAYGIVSIIPGLSLSSNTSKEVKQVRAYSSDVAEPDSNVFNKSAVNPTVDISIGKVTSDTGS